MNHKGFVPLAFILLSGCATTQVIEVTWNEATVADLNSRSGQASFWKAKDEKFATRQFSVGTDTLLLKTEFGLGEMQVTGKENFIRRKGSVHFWRFLPPGSIAEVRFVQKKRIRPLLLGAGAGAALAIFATMAAFQTSGFTELNEYILIGAAGAVPLGLAGLAIGRTQTTVYRFRGGRVSASPTGASVQLNLSR